MCDSMTAFLASLLGLPSPEQVGFLLSVWLAYAIGWTVRDIKERRLKERRRRAMWMGERVR